MTDEMEDFFANSGGAGGPSFKFAGIGTGVKGEVVKTQIQNQTKFKSTEFATDAAGNVLKRLAVVLMTDLSGWANTTDSAKVDENGAAKPASDDDGTRVIYVKGYMT